MKKYPVRCPVTSYLSVMDGHWKPIIIWYLRDKTLRFKNLQFLIPDISTKVLTQQLTELEADRIINRVVIKQLPPRVEYNLTDYGATLIPVLAAMRGWGLQHLQNNLQILHPDSEWQTLPSATDI